MSTHVTDRELAAFQDGHLPPAEVLAVDAHLAGCAGCRARAEAVSAHRSARLGAMLAASRSIASHPEDDELADFADGRGADAAAIARHVAACAECSATVDDLRLLRAAIETRTTRRKVGWRGLAVAAAILIAAGSMWMWRQPRPRVPVAATAAVEGLDRFAPAERTLIQSALETGTLPAAPNLEAVRTHQGRLMGTPAGARAPFGPLSPIATAVDGTQPEFRWSPLEGAATYVITIVDDQLRVVAESPLLTETRWRASAALPRGRAYSWQVRANLASGSRTAPAPPEPEAKFFVLSDAEAREVDAIRQRAQESPLAAILLARHGLMEDAEAELAKAAARDPSNAALRKLAAAAKEERAAATDRR